MTFLQVEPRRILPWFGSAVPNWSVIIVHMERVNNYSGEQDSNG